MELNYNAWNPNYTESTYGWGIPRQPEVTSTNYPQPSITHPKSRKPTDLLGEIERGQWSDYIRMYRPVEQQYRDMINAPAVYNTGDIGKAYDARKEATLRRLERYGGLTNPAQTRALERGFGLDRAATLAGSKNMTRDMWKDMSRQNLQKYTQVGRDIVDYSGQGLGAASAAEQQRQAQYEAEKAQAKAEQQQMIGTGVGAAVSIAGMMAVAY